jgi:hypothetical protein
MTDGQPASLSWYKAPIWGLQPDLYYSYDNYGFFFVGRPLWREDGPDFYICCWPLPAQSFFVPSPLGLATIFYCLTFETSLFVASFDSQGHGGGIRSRLHMGSSHSCVTGFITIYTCLGSCRAAVWPLYCLWLACWPHWCAHSQYCITLPAVSTCILQHQIIRVLPFPDN